MIQTKRNSAQHGTAVIEGTMALLLFLVFWFAIWAGARLFNVQEAVTNAVRHAHARHIAIELASQADATTLSVSDDGTGMPEVLPRGGMGLNIMRYRATIIGGSLMVEPRPDGGTVVRCTVPGQPASE